LIISIVFCNNFIHIFADSVFGVKTSHFTQFFHIAATLNQVQGGEAQITSGTQFF